MLNNVELQYKGLRILSRYCSCQDSEFPSAMGTSSVDIDKLLSKNFSKNCLLILPISGLQGFISRHVGLFLKFSLWSLRVSKRLSFSGGIDAIR